MNKKEKVYLLKLWNSSQLYIIIDFKCFNINQNTPYEVPSSIISFPGVRYASRYAVAAQSTQSALS